MVTLLLSWEVRFLSKLQMYKEIIYTKDKAYQLVRVIPEEQLKNPNMEDLKKFFHCDTLLRKQGLLYFCRLIEDVEFEEIDGI